jgi:hypothetical protein
MAFTSDVDRAQAAFNSALKQAEYTTRDIFNSFGLSRQDPSTGAWNTATSSTAFNPANLTTYDANTGVVGINQEQINALGKGQFGTAFGYNRMSEAMGQGAVGEASAKAGLRSRGIMGGGLAGQAASTAESQQTQQQAGVGADLLAALGQTYGSIGQGLTGLFSGAVETAGTGGQAISAAAGAGSTTAPTSTKPTQPGSKMYDISADRKWRWMGNASGWKAIK